MQAITVNYVLVSFHQKQRTRENVWSKWGLNPKRGEKKYSPEGKEAFGHWVSQPYHKDQRKHKRYLLAVGE